MPRIAIADDVRDRDASVGPISEQSLEPRKTLWHKMLVLDELVENIADQKKRAAFFCNLVLVRPQQSDGIVLGGAAFVIRAAP